MKSATPLTDALDLRLESKKPEDAYREMRDHACSLEEFTHKEIAQYFEAAKEPNPDFEFDPANC
jgi:hypothetical protein